MRLTTARLRSLLVNQAAFVAAARLPVMPSTNFGNPQRTWIQAAIRAYFEGRKDEAALWATFDRKVEEGRSSPRRTSLAAGARPLLDRFLTWHRADPELPADSFPPTRDVSLGSHSIAVRRDLIYIDGVGYKGRQLWTDHEMRPQHPRAIEMAAAVMLSIDHDLGEGLTTSVEVWGLRHNTQRSWSRGELVREARRLRDRLEAVALAIQEP